GPAAMEMNFARIVAGEGVRRFKEEDDALVDDRTVGLPEPSDRGQSALWQLPARRLDRTPDSRTRQADDGDTGREPSARQGHDRVGDVHLARIGRSEPKRPQVFMESKKSAFDLVCFSLSMRNSMASVVPIGARMRRSTKIFCRSCRGTSRSSLRVPDFRMSIDGKMRLSATFRSSTISELPVPLNSSKITSSMRLPVSISAVAMIVSEPPSSMLRAAPKNRFGRCSALASTPPVSTLPEDGTTV